MMSLFDRLVEESRREESQALLRQFVALARGRGESRDEAFRRFDRGRVQAAQREEALGFRVSEVVMESIYAVARRAFLAEWDRQEIDA